MGMKFTYDSYADLIRRLRERRYEITDYHNYNNYEKCVILRHDVDYDIDKALAFARYEKRLGIASTYFILLSSEFYNLCSKRVFERVEEIAGCGHEIGLHFDETRYETEIMEEVRRYIKKEAGLMESMLQMPIQTVSMHRPSKEVLEADLEIPGMVNSYGRQFFEEFKYVSDSRMVWREDVFRIIELGEFKQLHILTHPFWYEKEEETTGIKLERFLKEAYKVRYASLHENFRNLEEYEKEFHDLSTSARKNEVL